MASNLLKVYTQSTNLPLFHSQKNSHKKVIASAFPFSRSSHSYHISNLILLPKTSLYISSKRPQISIQCCLNSPTPPATKEDAVLQAKTSISTTLAKPLNNPKPVGKLKKQKQPRFRVEIPVIDDSPQALIQLAFDVFRDIRINKRGPSVKILLIWPNPATLTSALEAFKGVPSGAIEHIELSTAMNVNDRILNSGDVAVFLAPNASQLTVMKLVSDSLNPRPLVLFNPKWAFEDEGDLGEISSFVGSFDVVYAFIGLEVRGILSKRRGVVFKYVKDGVVSSEKWNVLVEEETEGNPLKVVSRFKTRPTITEVENVMYNLMAANSPITKSAKFLRELVSNVTGKKQS